MVRILPSRSRLLPGSASHSRSSSPMRGNNGATIRDTGLTLKVVIMKARNLAAKDKSGTSDPYLVLNLGDSRIVTHSVPKTLNPEWNVVEAMPVNSTSSLILEVICWDKDRFGKDYLGEFDVALEEIFANGKTSQEARWYPLSSKRRGKKNGVVSGEVQLQFTLLDSTNTLATHSQVFEKFAQLTGSGSADVHESPSSPPSQTHTPTQYPALTSGTRSPASVVQAHDSMADDDDGDDGYFNETQEQRRRRRVRIKGLRARKRQNPYAFSRAGTLVVGVIFLEICNAKDLPPERNLTRLGFDMDPFVVTSLGRQTYRTRTIRHCLNPVWNEKMVFNVLSHEQLYSFGFAVIDRDHYSGNDFIASCDLPIQQIIDRAPHANPETGLYDLPEPPDYVRVPSRTRILKIGRTNPSQTTVNKTSRPSMSKHTSRESSMSSSYTIHGFANSAGPEPSARSNHGNAGHLINSGSNSNSTNNTSNTNGAESADLPSSADATPMPSDQGQENRFGSGSFPDDAAFHTYHLPLKMKHQEKWESKHHPVLRVRAKYMPYAALRQQFWRSMLRQYDADETGGMSKIELTTMLDSLGSTLHESTIDGFFRRFHHTSDGLGELSIDEAVICLEDQLDFNGRSGAAAVKTAIVEKVQAAFSNITGALDSGLANASMGGVPSAEATESGTLLADETSMAETGPDDSGSIATAVASFSQVENASTITAIEHDPADEAAEALDRTDDLNVDRGEEHVVEIRECPICHQPRLNKRTDADIVTHIATCASQDWRQVHRLVMGGFVTASQAQRKWYSKVITKISYGGYKLGANSANILVQDRATGLISEEKMSVYVRLGIRLLYKGLMSRDMEKKRIRKMLKSLSIKQGRKYDDPVSRGGDIEKFVHFHRLDMSEVLLPIEAFRNFNEFFYRALKPGMRPCSAPNNPGIVVSPADCRSVVFNKVDQATKIWIKGREFSIRRLFGDAYPEEVARYESSGALGVFRLAPQDYHRFHVPVDGVLGEPRLIEGEYYTVNPMAIRSALDVFGENVRVLVPIDSTEHGRVMVVCVGAMMVGSTVITRTAGERVSRAEELGYFKFGGSTLILLFEEGKIRFDDDLVDNSMGALETLLRVGMSIGHSPTEPQWKADMRKHDGNVTEAEKKEAHRRIAGGQSEDASPDASGDDSPNTVSVTPPRS